MHKLLSLCSRIQKRSRVLAVAGVVVLFGAAAPAQETKGDERPDKVEISPFGGVSFYHDVSTGLGTKHANGGVAGIRVTENFWRYVGLEQGYTYSTANVMFQSPTAPGLPNYGFGSRLHQFNLNPVFHFTPRGSAFRPYITAGASAMNFTPTDTAKALARLPENAAYGAQALNSNLQAGLNYGGGVKYHLTDRFGLRFDVRGLMSRNPTYVLPDAVNTPTVYIPRGDKLHGVQTTVGVNFYLGSKYVPPPPPVAQPRALGALSGGALDAGSGTLCQGRPITIRSSGVSDPDGRQITYKWKVNGQPAGGNSPELQFTPDKPGAYQIELDVEAPNEAGMPVRTAKANTINLNIQEYRAPTVTACSANPASLNYGGTSALSATASGSPCSTTQFKWTTTEGVITNDTSTTATFDSKSVQFEQGGKIQSKTVTITGTVTDDRGATASCNVAMKVDYTPQAVRFSDLIFGKGSARVNNCAKRILLEEVAAKAADPDYDIVLVGHYDQDEAARGNRATTLDAQRVKNAIAVLTAGTGTCARVDRSRIKADWVGTTQTSDFQPGVCGTSSRSATEERRGSAVSTADQNRRVEVWLVPRGTANPASFGSAKEVTDAEMKKLACPR